MHEELRITLSENWFEVPSMQTTRFLDLGFVMGAGFVSTGAPVAFRVGSGLVAALGSGICAEPESGLIDSASSGSLKRSIVGRAE